MRFLHLLVLFQAVTAGSASLYLLHVDFVSIAKIVVVCAE